MRGKRILSSNNEIIYFVEDLNEFFTYDKNFVTDGNIYIKGNKRIEYRVSNASFIFIPKNKVLFLKE